MTAPDLPAHASPALPPIASPQPKNPSTPQFSLSRSSVKRHATITSALSDSLITPTQTPPSTPGNDTVPTGVSNPTSFPVDPSQEPARNLLARLPKVDCLVRTRIPTKFGQMWLHVYQNNIDSKEHLAIVFGDTIRSKSLFATRQGETEQDRIVRGAYEGTLYPGRTHSGLEAANGSTEKMSPLLQSLHKPIGGTSNGAPAKSEFMSLPRNASHSISSSSVSSGSADSLKMDIDRQQSSLPLVRIHSECYTGETVWSARCDCGEQLDEAARLMSEPSAARSGGVIIYLRQEGRGIGLSEKLKAYNLQDLGNDTVEANILLRHPADARSYGLATAMLMDLGLGRDDEEAEETARSDVDCGNDIQMREGSGIRLLTNNPEKIRAVEGPNREIVVRERVEMVPITMGEEKTHYMKTKAD